MKKLHSLSLATILAMATLTAFAQQEAAPTPMPAMAAPVPVDCAKAPTKRHDHGAERGLGATNSKTMDAACAPDGAASATGSKTKKKSLHDHAKFHKNQ